MNSTWQIDEKMTSSKSSFKKEFRRKSIPLEIFEMNMRNISDAAKLIDNLISSKKGKRIENNCHHTECMDPWADCYPCGPLQSDTDLKLMTRMGEVRLLSVLFENNRNVSCDVTLGISQIMDPCGNIIYNKEIIELIPASFTLGPGCCKRFHVRVRVANPLQERQAYYTEIKILGDCCAKAISMGIWIQPDNYVDHLSLCDACRPNKGEFIEFKNTDEACCAEGKTYYICNCEPYLTIK